MPGIWLSALRSSLCSPEGPLIMHYGSLLNGAGGASMA
jgi:hypothetical protein